MSDNKGIEKIKELIRQSGKDGKVLFMTPDGIVQADMDKFISQPANGILYDLNKLPEVVMSRDDKGIVNDYAAQLVIKALKDKIKEIQTPKDVE